MGGILDWEEYRYKLSFSPAARSNFVNYLVHQRVSPDLAQSLVELEVLDVERDTKALEMIRQSENTETVTAAVFGQDLLDAGTLTERVDRVVKTIIEPVPANDGGRLDILNIDEGLGELRMRFAVSCANCPYSLLSMEQSAKSPLLAIPGIQRVVHRAKARNSELVVLAQTASPLVELTDTAAPPLAP